MPYKYDDKWHRDQRKFIGSKRDSGRVNGDSENQYEGWLHHA